MGGHSLIAPAPKQTPLVSADVGPGRLHASAWDPTEPTCPVTWGIPKPTRARSSALRDELGDAERLDACANGMSHWAICLLGETRWRGS